MVIHRVGREERSKEGSNDNQMMDDEHRLMTEKNCSLNDETRHEVINIIAEETADKELDTSVKEVDPSKEDEAP